MGDKKFGVTALGELLLDVIGDSRIFTLSMTHEGGRKATCKAIDHPLHARAG